MIKFQNVKVFVKTDIGLKRETNEDNYLVVDGSRKSNSTENKGMMFAVADGMSGHVGGEIASKMACEGLRKYYSSEICDNVDEIKDSYEIKLKELEGIIFEIDSTISNFGERKKEYEYMGTTLSVLVLIKEKALIAHVGDSRIYRFRHDNLEQLTEDDTMAQLSVEMGLLKPEEAISHPLRHTLIQALGQGIDEVHSRIEDIKRGDLFLLCSDGLYDMVPDDSIRTILLYTTPQKACDRLVDEALKNGGRDNVTVMVVRI